MHNMQYSTQNMQYSKWKALWLPSVCWVPASQDAAASVSRGARGRRPVSITQHPQVPPSAPAQMGEPGLPGLALQDSRQS